jgi:hypothetical protein
MNTGSQPPRPEAVVPAHSNCLKISRIIPFVTIGVAIGIGIGIDFENRVFSIPMPIPTPTPN